MSLTNINGVICEDGNSNRPIGTSTNMVSTSGNQTIGGIKTFTSPVSINTLNIKGINPTLSFIPLGTGNAYNFEVGGVNPAQDTVIGFIDPSVSTCNLMFDNTGGTITQLTSITTAITLNKRGGLITMFAALTAGQSGAFTFNNSYITATSQILAWSQNTVSATSPVGVLVVISAITSGHCTITVSNGDSAHTQASAAIVQFLII